MRPLYINITHIWAVCGILIVLYQRKARNVDGGEMEMKANGVRSQPLIAKTLIGLLDYPGGPMRDN